ncbi:hypothetical protein BD769DRAFT_1683055 [Suillus cothurnatus]|nr:hypothetical protein BD769DRAFT_1683055 [Suillus cothurnatus]
MTVPDNIDNIDNAMDIDIFAPPALLPDDEVTMTLKRDFDVQRERLRALVQSAPAEDAGDVVVDVALHDWCRQWEDLNASITRLMKLTREHKVADTQLTVAEREVGHTGRKIYDRLQCQLIAMKEAAAERAEETPQAQLEAEQERLAQVEKNNGEEGQTAEKEVDAQEDDAQDEEDEGHAEEDETHAEEDEEDEVNAQVEDNSQVEENDNAQEDDAPEESPIKRSARVYTAKKISPLVPSEPDIETMEVAPKQAEPVVHNKRVTRKDIKELGTNVIPCKTCAGLKIDCVRTEGGYVCAHCKRRKMACSLVPGKSKPNPAPNATTPIPPPHSTSTTRPRPTLVLRPGNIAKTGPAPKATTPATPADIPSASKPRPTNGLNNLGIDAKAGPAAKATGAGHPSTKGKGKAADAPSQRVTPGPLSTQRVHVDLPVSYKRKLANIEDDSNSDESDDEDEDAYLLRKSQWVHGYLCLFDAYLERSTAAAVASVDSLIASTLNPQDPTLN